MLNLNVSTKSLDINTLIQKSRKAAKAREQWKKQGGESGRPRLGSVKLCLRLLDDARHGWGNLLALFLLGLVSTPLALLTPFSLKIAVDSVLGSKPLPALLQAIFPRAWQVSPTAILVFACALALSIQLLQAMQAFGTWVYELYTEEKLVLDARVRLFGHVQRMSLRDHGAMGASDLLYRLQYDAFCMQGIAIHGLIPACSSLVMFLTMFGVTLLLDWQLALLSLGILPIMWGISRLHARKSRGHWSEVKETETTAISVLKEVLDGIRVVKAFAQEERETSRFRERASHRLRRYLGAIRTETEFGLLVTGVIATVSAASLYLGVRHVQLGVLTLGNFLVVMAYLVKLLKPLETFSQQVAAIQGSLASAERVYSLYDESPDLTESPSARAMVHARGDIEFRSVCFGYREDRITLENVSFRAAPGQRVGIVGPTGSGKTTLINLLGRFYDPESGSILLDGIDLRDIRLADLRRQFAFVLQEPVLFSGSIAENISYGKPDAGIEEIEAAARAAGAHEFITSMPDGYETEVGERGSRLSGGERQRVSIARAFLVDAPVLVLDEPTNSVDRAMEESIAASLERLQHGRTTITITHHPALLKDYDMILRIECGRRIEGE